LCKTKNNYLHLCAQDNIAQWFSNWGPQENFLVTAKHLPKNQHDTPEEKILCKIKFSGNLFFQTKLNKHNLELW